MPVTTLRLSAAEKREFTAAARRQGLTLPAYLRTIAHQEVARSRTSFAAWARRAAGVVDSGKRTLSSREGFGD